jgi:ABC-2 type transport system ATP-binding protein
MVEVAGLCKQFGSFKAIDQLDFTLGASEIVGLIGPNGAGKSTTLHILLGFISRTSGTLRIFGRDPEAARDVVFARLNFTSPYVGLPPRLSVLENLSIYARLYGVSNPAALILSLLQRLGCEHLQNANTARLSSGELARVMLCKALLNDPALLILDEPAANLDPCAADDIKAILEERRDKHGTSILITSHNLNQVEQICDRIIIINHGRIQATGTSLEVTRKILGADKTRASLDDVFKKLASAPGRHQ